MNSSCFKLIVFLLVCYTCSCTATRPSTATPVPTGIPTLRFLGDYTIPYNLRFNNTVVGGLSGIDYDSSSNCYYFICDDRSALGPARFYTAKINVSGKGIDSVVIIATHRLLQANGDSFPAFAKDPHHTTDPEAMRYYPPLRRLYWSSEGERIVKATDTILTDPTVQIISLEGKYIHSLNLPPNLHMEAIEKGPRQNGVLEGMTFDDNYKTLYINVEEPLYEDGPRADTIPNKAFIRLFKFNLDNKTRHEEFAYTLDPVAFAPTPPAAFKVNGVPDILAIGNGQLLVIERSFSTGRLQCTIKVFLADPGKATNIANIPALKNRSDFTTMSKQLLLNMDDLGIYIDNIEGCTFGPTLPNGNRTLLFVSDNNFNSLEKTQLLLFEMIER